MKYWRRLSIVVIGFLESLLFSGCLFGWPSLLYVLQQEGVYSHLCTNNYDSGNENYSATISHMNLNDHEREKDMAFTLASGNDNDNFFEDSMKPLYSSTEKGSDDNIVGAPEPRETLLRCKEQTIQMTLIYTVAAVSYGLTSILIGFALDICGLWFTRIGGCVMTSGGFFILAFTTRDTSWFLWPALNLIALGSSQLRLSSFQFANCWPEYRTTILILYSSAYSVSTTLFLVIQIAYVGNIPYKVIGLALALLSLLTFPPTLIMPRMKIEDHKDETVSNEEDFKKGKKISEDEDAKNAHEDDDIPRILKSKDGNERTKMMNPFDDPDVEKVLPQKEIEVPLGTSLWTLSAAFHLFWHFITFFLVLFYSATFMLWIQIMTDDPKTIEHYNKVSGACALIAPIFIPLAGMVTDWQIRQAAKSEDRVERLALTMQAPALTKALASCFVLGTMICKVFFTPAAIYASMVLIAISRPFIVGSCASYIRIRFHPSHFNRLNGIFTTLVSILALLQFPIIVWMKRSIDDFVMAQLVLIGILILAFTSPGHMLIKPIARKYAKQQVKFRTDI